MGHIVANFATPPYPHLLAQVKSLSKALPPSSELRCRFFSICSEGKRFSLGNRRESMKRSAIYCWERSLPSNPQNGYFCDGVKVTPNHGLASSLPTTTHFLLNHPICQRMLANQIKKTFLPLQLSSSVHCQASPRACQPGFGAWCRLHGR